MEFKFLKKEAWIEFALCFFLGAYGIHLFRKRKIGWGILYLLTGGLFGFGWLYDWIRSLIYALWLTLGKPSENGFEMARERILKIGKTVALCGVIISFVFTVGSCAFWGLILGSDVPESEGDQAVEKQEEENPLPEEPVTEEPSGDQPEPPAETIPEEQPQEETPVPNESPKEPQPPKEEPPQEVHTHNFSAASCTQPKICASCGEKAGEALGHNWKGATCTSPKTCSRCGATEGNASAHKWKDATYTAPKTCSSCGATEGNPLEKPGAENYHGHVYTGGASSKRFHYEAECAGKNSHEITWAEVQSKGLTACGTCVLK